MTEKKTLITPDLQQPSWNLLDQWTYYRPKTKSNEWKFISKTKCSSQRQHPARHSNERVKFSKHNKVHRKRPLSRQYSVQFRNPATL